MEQVNKLLNLPEHATASDRACAVYELMQEYNNIQAARDTAEHECMALRGATSHIFVESVCAARGITDAAAQEDIRAAWCADPYAALNALAGENITAANPYGCNQYGHEWKGKHGEGWQPRGDRQRDIKKDKELSDLEKEQKGMQKAHKDYEDAQEKYRQARKKVFDLEDEIEKALKRGDKEKETQLEQEQEKARKEWQKASEEAKKATNAYSEQSKRYRAVKYGEKGKNLSDALKKIAPRTDKNGQGLMPFAKKKQ